MQKIFYYFGNIYIVLTIFAILLQVRCAWGRPPAYVQSFYTQNPTDEGYKTAKKIEDKNARVQKSQNTVYYDLIFEPSIENTGSPPFLLHQDVFDSNEKGSGWRGAKPLEIQSSKQISGQKTNLESITLNIPSNREEIYIDSPNMKQSRGAEQFDQKLSHRKHDDTAISNVQLKQNADSSISFTDLTNSQPNQNLFESNLDFNNEKNEHFFSHVPLSDIQVWSNLDKDRVSQSKSDTKEIQKGYDSKHNDKKQIPETLVWEVVEKMNQQSPYEDMNKEKTSTKTPYPQPMNNTPLRSRIITLIFQTIRDPYDIRWKNEENSALATMPKTYITEYGTDESESYSQNDDYEDEYDYAYYDIPENDREDQGVVIVKQPALIFQHIARDVDLKGDNTKHYKYKDDGDDRSNDDNDDECGNTNIIGERFFANNYLNNFPIL